MNKRDEIRKRALADLQKHHVLMLDGHFDFGNGYHGRVYLNPHQLFRQPSTIWRFPERLNKRTRYERRRWRVCRSTTC